MKTKVALKTLGYTALYAGLSTVLSLLSTNSGLLSGLPGWAQLLAAIAVPTGLGVLKSSPLAEAKELAKQGQDLRS